MAKRKTKWKIDPITGLKYEKNSLMDLTFQGANLAVKGLGELTDLIKNKEMRKNLPEKVSLVYNEIKEFKPAKKELKHEYNYQLNLHGWLSKTFPSAVIERQKGRSRPDIVIDKIAIEIKGPTNNRELKTIADKIIRYSQFFDQIFIVLFEVKDEIFYKEWHKGIERQFSNVIVIRKS